MSVIAEPTSTRQVRERHATHARTCTRDAVTKTPAYPSHAHRARQIIQSRKHSTAFADDSGVVLDAQASNVKPTYWSIGYVLLPLQNPFCPGYQRQVGGTNTAVPSGSHALTSNVGSAACVGKVGC